MLPRLLCLTCLFLLANAPLGLRLLPGAPAAKLAVLCGLAAFFLVYQFRPCRLPDVGRRLRVLAGGMALLRSALLLLVAELVFYLFFRPAASPALLGGNIACALFVALCLVVNGYCRILCASVQLSMRLRLLLLLLWWLPPLNYFLLWRAYCQARREYDFELARRALDDSRRDGEICRTKYPLLLVHGIFFRDWQLVNYWGRIPAALRRNGAEIAYGGQQSAAGVAASAAELRARIFALRQELGCEKVNIIAHSKGGLDARYAISRLGMAPYVASLTTVNTPHRGCLFVERLLAWLPERLVTAIASRYDALFRRLGDAEPDFIAGVRDLTATRCAALAREAPDAAGVYYQSVTSALRGPRGAGFPLNLSYLLIRCLERAQSDGLVTVDSARWGSFLECVTARRGVSHGDIIDLTRKNLDGFDVREFYVSLVRGLKERGL